MIPMRAVALTLTAALIAAPSLALVQDDCRSGFSQRDLEDLLIEAFEAAERPDNAVSSHCVFQIDLPGMDVPETGAELGSCRWQGVDGETAFLLDPEHPDRVTVMRGGEEMATLNLCDV